MLRTLTGMAVAAACFSAAPAAASIIWTDWTNIDSSTATGNIDGITVTLGGPFDNWQISGGTDYWRQGGVTPWPAYDGVTNLPANNDFIAPSGSQATHVISFSSPVTDPYFAIISLGQYGIQTNWTFDAPFTLIDQGQGFWGNGAFTIVGNSITAGEAHGIIRFQGTYSQITLVTNNTENWSGLTIGIEAVPEPAAWAMLIMGFGLVGIAARRRDRSLAA